VEWFQQKPHKILSRPLLDFLILRIVFTGMLAPPSILLHCNSGRSAAQTRNPDAQLQILSSSWLAN